jgi:branched-chain amino acid transport system permease protein
MNPLSRFARLTLDGIRDNRLLWALIAGFALFPIVTHLADLPFWNDVAMRIMLLGMAAMGLNLVLGYGGMVSFGHAAFIGIGAYCVGISQFYGITNGWAHLAFSVLACGMAGLVIGCLALRTSGIYFIMITLAFAQMLFFLFVSLETFGGDDGMSIDRAEFAIIDLYEPLRLYFLIWTGLALVGLALMFIVRSRFGVTLRAIKSNESRIEAMGLFPLRFKMTGYVISAVICGIAGALFASWQEYVSPDIMHWTRSGELMIIIILGGLGTLAGPLLGAIVFLLLEEMLPILLGAVAPAYAENWMILFGPLLIMVVLFGRGGLVGLVGRWRTKPAKTDGKGSSR